MGAQQSSAAGPAQDAVKPGDAPGAQGGDLQAVKAHAIDCCSVASSYQSISELEDFLKPGELALTRWSRPTIAPSEILNNPIYEGDELNPVEEEREPRLAPSGSDVAIPPADRPATDSPVPEQAAGESSGEEAAAQFEDNGADGARSQTPAAVVPPAPATAAAAAADEPPTTPIVGVPVVDDGFSASIADASVPPADAGATLLALRRASAEKIVSAAAEPSIAKAEPQAMAASAACLTSAEATGPQSSALNDQSSLAATAVAADTESLAAASAPLSGSKIAAAGPAACSACETATAGAGVLAVPPLPAPTAIPGEPAEAAAVPPASRRGSPVIGTAPEPAQTAFVNDDNDVAAPAAAEAEATATAPDTVIATEQAANTIEAPVTHRAPVDSVSGATAAAVAGAAEGKVVTAADSVGGPDGEGARTVAVATDASSGGPDVDPAAPAEESADHVSAVRPQLPLELPSSPSDDSATAPMDVATAVISPPKNEVTSPAAVQYEDTPPGLTADAEATVTEPAVAVKPAVAEAGVAEQAVAEAEVTEADVAEQAAMAAEAVEPPASGEPMEPAVQLPAVAAPIIAEATMVESVVLEPAVAEPAVAEPAVAEPAVAEPAVAEPAVAEPVVAEPAVAEPAVAEPEVAEPAVAEPEVAEPAAAELTVAQTTVRETAVAETAVTEPAVLEPSMTGSTLAETTAKGAAVAASTEKVEAVPSVKATAEEMAAAAKQVVPSPPLDAAPAGVEGVAPAVEGMASKDPAADAATGPVGGVHSGDEESAATFIPATPVPPAPSAPAADRLKSHRVLDTDLYLSDEDDSASSPSKTQQRASRAGTPDTVVYSHGRDYQADITGARPVHTKSGQSLMGDIADAAARATEAHSTMKGEAKENGGGVASSPDGTTAASTEAPGSSSPADTLGLAAGAQIATPFANGKEAAAAASAAKAAEEEAAARAAARALAKSRAKAEKSKQGGIFSCFGCFSPAQ